MVGCPGGWSCNLLHRDAEDKKIPLTTVHHSVAHILILFHRRQVRQSFSQLTLLQLTKRIVALPIADLDLR
jgi:hypothetical protein